MKDANEECDDANSENRDTCLDTCFLAFCGDGFINGDEECDDGNRDDNDSCNVDCVLRAAPAPTDGGSGGCSVDVSRTPKPTTVWLLLGALVFLATRRRGNAPT